jgi:hypothetical protein
MRLTTGFILVMTAGLIGCGGGGGSGGANVIPSASLQGTPTSIVAPDITTYDYSLGTPSNDTDARAALYDTSLFSLPYTSVYGSPSFSSLSKANNSINSGQDPRPSRDTNATQVWAQGWSGKGVDVRIVDDFNSNGQIDTHGDSVSLVVHFVAPEANQGAVHLGDYGSFSFDAGITANNTAFADGFEIVNNSWGVIQDADYNDAFDSELATYVANFNPASQPTGPQALSIWAAGNNAAKCESLVGSRRLEDCEFLAATVAALRDQGETAGENYLWVGAVQDNADIITDYSLEAGALALDFLVANDDVLATGDAAGTSFAAPRVAGAAALVKQKFPNLNTQQLKQVLLQTASDLGLSGPDSVYGYGKLNINSALSPIGGLSP